MKKVKRLVSYGQVIKMIYDSVIQNDITNHYNWWGVIKQDENAEPPKPTEEQLRERERNFYRQFIDSGNTDMSLLNAEQQKEFTDAENRVTSKYGDMPESKRYRNLVFGEVNNKRAEKIGQQTQQPQQPKRGLTRRALGLGAKAGKGVLGAAKRNIRDAVTMPIEGAKKLGRGIADSVSRTQQGLQERTDYDTKRMVGEIDAKTPEIKSKEAQQIKQLAGSRVFGRPLVDAMQKELLLQLMREIESNPDAYSRGSMRTASGGYTRGESIDKVAEFFGMNSKDKTTVRNIFGNDLTPVAVKALQILSQSKEGRTPRRTSKKDKKKVQRGDVVKPMRPRRTPTVTIGGD